jgi:hypothetical protein
MFKSFYGAAYALSKGTAAIKWDMIKMEADD